MEKIEILVRQLTALLEEEKNKKIQILQLLEEAARAMRAGNAPMAEEILRRAAQILMS